MIAQITKWPILYRIVAIPLVPSIAPQLSSSPIPSLTACARASHQKRRRQDTCTRVVVRKIEYMGYRAEEKTCRDRSLLFYR